MALVVRQVTWELDSVGGGHTPVGREEVDCPPARGRWPSAATAVAALSCAHGLHIRRSRLCAQLCDALLVLAAISAGRALPGVMVSTCENRDASRTFCSRSALCAVRAGCDVAAAARCRGHTRERKSAIANHLRDTASRQPHSLVSARDGVCDFDLCYVCLCKVGRGPV
eukprot:2555474-Prymnesium_polylepis.1